MSINLLYCIAIVLMVLGAFGFAPTYGTAPGPVRSIGLWQLGWAFVIAALVTGGYIVHL